MPNMSKEKRSGVPVSEKALVQRINRKFVSLHGSMGMKLNKTRGLRASLTLGDFYVLDVKSSLIFEHHVDPEKLGRKLGVLEKFEYLVAD